MASSVVALDHPNARDAALAGGKCAALARLVAATLPVPPGFGGDRVTARLAC
ncbi:MAG: hypothetical protein IH866_00130 [Chloroflexi bacterium]|nr:hypothetical protein [Chloroflexota bacterium]